MSDMHGLEGNGSTYRVVMHFASPIGNNLAGVSWVDSLKGSGATTVLVEGTDSWEITTIEKATIEAGGIVERVVSVDVESGRDTLALVTTALRHAYALEKRQLSTNISNRFRIYGMVESEA